MAPSHNHPPALADDVAAWLMAGGALLLVLRLHLLPALLAGLFVHELVHVLSPRLKMVRIRQEQGKLAAIAILALGVVLLLTLAVVGIIAFFRSEAGSLPTLLRQMADILERWRTVLPARVVAYLPEDVEALRATAVAWLRTHAGALPHAGAALGRTLAHILIGLGIGALVALYDAQPPETFGPLAHALQERASRLGEAFRRVVFAQMRISA